MPERITWPQETEISFEFWDKTQNPIGTKTLKDFCLPTRKGVHLLRMFKNLSLDRNERQALCYCLDNNSPKTTGKISLERGVSAYFYIFPEGLIVEWGKINPLNQNAKVHDYLNQNSQRSEQEERRSGHVSFACFNSNDFYVAKIDSISGGVCKGSGFLIGENLVLNDNSLEYHLVRILLGNGIAPLTSDGHLMLTPFYNRELFKIKRGIGVS